MGFLDSPSQQNLDFLRKKTYGNMGFRSINKRKLLRGLVWWVIRLVITESRRLCREWTSLLGIFSTETKESRSPTSKFYTSTIRGETGLVPLKSSSAIPRRVKESTVS